MKFYPSLLDIASVAYICVKPTRVVQLLRVDRICCGTSRGSGGDK